MRFVIVSLNNDKIRRITQILNARHHDIDTGRPDFVVTHGGDGTILYAERKYPGIPKIAIRGSSGGYKCLYNESDLENIILKIENGEYGIREEPKLETLFKEIKYLSLNEVQVHNQNPTKAIRFSILVDKKPLYWDVVGDGVVVTAPFGSTAYYASVSGFKSGFSGNWIGIVLNNPYKYEHDKGVIDKFCLVDINSYINIKIIRDGGLLLFDNDNNAIIVKEGDEISIGISKNMAKFITV